MPAPGSALSSQFDGADITGFLEWFNMVSDMAELSESNRIRMLPMYCGEIREEVQILIGADGMTWDEAQTILKEEYCMQDSSVIRKEVQYLERLANKHRDSDDEIRQFVH
jgi:hypothetical protein